jgi:hypothetical protein
MAARIAWLVHVRTQNDVTPLTSARCVGLAVRTTEAAATITTRIVVHRFHPSAHAMFHCAHRHPTFRVLRFLTRKK